MTDLYDQRIDAMKARERYNDSCAPEYSMSIPDTWNAGRNIERLAAYKRKRLAMEANHAGM